MDIEVKLDARGLERIAALSDTVDSLLAERIRPIADEILDDARERAQEHFHSLGAKPGLYLAGFHDGVKLEADGSVVGFVANSNPLAHLLEYGFTITDLLIEANGAAMKFFEPDVGDLYRREVHRHETEVRAYPALTPAFEARKAEIVEAVRDVARGL